MGEIVSCKQRGFHKHSDLDGNNMFEKCSHVDYTRGNDFKVIDLRESEH